MQLSSCYRVSKDITKCSKRRIGPYGHLAPKGPTGFAVTSGPPVIRGFSVMLLLGVRHISLSRNPIPARCLVTPSPLLCRMRRLLEPPVALPVPNAGHCRLHCLCREGVMPLPEWVCRLPPGTIRLWSRKVHKDVLSSPMLASRGRMCINAGDICPEVPVNGRCLLLVIWVYRPYPLD